MSTQGLGKGMLHVFVGNAAAQRRGFCQQEKSCSLLGWIQAPQAHLERFGELRGMRVVPGDPAPIPRSFPRQLLQHTLGLVVALSQ